LGALAGAVLASGGRTATPGWTAWPASAAAVVLLTRGHAFAGGLAAAWTGTGHELRRALADRLPPADAGRRVRVTGIVADLPVRGAGRLTFTLLVETPRDLPRRIRLSWYEGRERPAPGDRWVFDARLRAPRGLANPGGLDWEGWLLRAGIGATGYASGANAGRRLAAGAARGTALRGAAAIRIERAIGPGRAAAVVIAIGLGFRGSIDAATRETLAATGTGHLLAISGLHVGLAAGAAGLLCAALWRRCAPGRRPVRDIAGAGALAAAFGYGAIAGMPVSARRAVLMTAVGIVALVARRRVPAAAVLGTALLVVLGFDPLAVLDPGLWLSFGAVAAILAVVAGRRRAAGRLVTLLRIQAALTVGLAAISVAWFGRVSLVAPAANLLAVPWFSLFVVPPALAGVLVSSLAPPLAQACFVTAGAAVEVALAALEQMAQWQGASAWIAEPEPWRVAAATAGAGWLLMPRPAPARVAALALLVPLTSGPAPLAEGAYEVRVLDVGQGESVLVRTRGSALLYDAGPAWPGGDAGARAVLPALRALGVRRLDTLIVSHADGDHAGGAGSVIAGLPVDRRLVGTGVSVGASTPCRAGQSWVADGVRFEILHPVPEYARRRNDGSCVLLVAGAGGRTLVAGDVERAGESALLASRETLAVDLLVAPHHGSRTSSSAPLVAATRPAWVVFPVGWRNRWGFPAPQIVARWRSLGALPLATDRQGEVAFRFDRSGPAPPRSRRAVECRPWRDCG
jgi:competence protein ComEC